MRSRQQHKEEGAAATIGEQAAVRGEEKVHAATREQAAATFEEQAATQGGEKAAPAIEKQAAAQ